MANEVVTFSGVVGAAYCAPWSMGGKSGISRSVLVFPSFLIDDGRVGPTKVSIHEDDIARFEEILEAGPGAAVEGSYALQERNYDGKKSISRQLLTLTSVKAPGRRQVRAAA